MAKVRKQKVKRGVPRRYGNAARADKRRRHFNRAGRPYTGR
jgi:hypothetical protein